MDFVFIVVR